MNATIENANLDAAVADYVSLQNRQKHPDGEFDRQGRWYPSSKEWQECCSQVRHPSRAYPYSFMVHCRTAEHVARRHGVEARAVRAAARKASAPRREGGEDYYKAVLVDGDRLISIHETLANEEIRTEYRLGVTLRQRARQEHGGGYYVYPSAASALVYLDGFDARPGTEAVVLRCRASGSYCRYGEKLAFGELTPIEIVRRMVYGAGGWETV